MCYDITNSGIEEIDGEQKYYDGPCVCVDTILAENGAGSIAEFVEAGGTGADGTRWVGVPCGLRFESHVQFPVSNATMPCFCGPFHLRSAR